MTDAEVDELREQVAKLKGRRPRSRDPVYLTALLAQLRDLKRNGEPVRATKTEHSVPVSLSMLPAQREALLKLCDKLKTSTSALVRQALSVYAADRGYIGIARELEDER